MRLNSRSKVRRSLLTSAGGWRRKTLHRYLYNGVEKWLTHGPFALMIPQSAIKNDDVEGTERSKRLTIWMYMLRRRYTRKIWKSRVLRSIRATILPSPLGSSTFTLFRTFLGRIHTLPWRLWRSIEPPRTIVRFWRRISPVVCFGTAAWGRGRGNDWFARPWYNGEGGARYSRCPPYQRREHDLYRQPYSLVNRALWMCCWRGTVWGDGVVLKTWWLLIELWSMFNPKIGYSCLCKRPAWLAT